MSSQSQPSRIPGMPRFVPAIDLMDETIREGVERSPIVPEPAALAELAEAIAAIGLRTIVVGFLPRHGALLRDLLERQARGRIPAAVRFMVISHLGEAMERTARALAEIGAAAGRVEVITIFPASDEQLEFLLPAISGGSSAPAPAATQPRGTPAERRRASLETLAARAAPGGRAAPRRAADVLVPGRLPRRAGHAAAMVAAATGRGIRQIRIVDTSGVADAGTGARAGAGPAPAPAGLRLYGHFHNDYELATANATSALAAGFKGVDVSVGGFANRAGHPSLAGLTMALRDLYDLTLASFDYAGLTALSRRSEQCLGLMESPTQAVTGAITHASLNGHRSDLLKFAPRIFSQLVPDDVGARPEVRYGGSDGLANFLSQHGAELRAALAAQGRELDETAVRAAWRRRNEAVADGLRVAMAAYHRALLAAAPAQAEMLELITHADADAVRRPGMYLAEPKAACTRAEIVALLRSDRIETISAAEAAAHESFVAELTERAYRHGDEAAEAELHKLLFAINVAALQPPWEAPVNNARSVLFVRLRSLIERAWEAHDRARFAPVLAEIPPVERFAQWATERIQRHPGNVDHELFAFMRDHATRAQLTEFQHQETPFDIYFGDIIALMLPGVYGALKMELVSNYFDEMGCGDAGMVHRSLRLHMMKEIGIDPDAVKGDLDGFCLPQLRLANMYFDAVVNREKLYQAIGMLLATELMVPGRLEYQIEGWKRVGLAPDEMVYLQLHTTVDITHAEGWLNNVVVPLLERDPAAMAPMTLGMYRRLVYAADVCDYMLEHMRRMER